MVAEHFSYHMINYSRTKRIPQFCLEQWSQTLVLGAKFGQQDHFIWPQKQNNVPARAKSW